jgi:hypothetical protein
MSQGQAMTYAAHILHQKDECNTKKPKGQRGNQQLLIAINNFHALLTMK